MSYTVKKENKGRKGEAFIVRNENASWQAAFAYRYDAELFATMIGCESCREEVAGHARMKNHPQSRRSGWGNPSQEREAAHRLNQTGHA